MAGKSNRLFVILALLVGLWSPDFRPSRPLTTGVREEADVTSNEG